MGFLSSLTNSNPFNRTLAPAVNPPLAPITAPVTVPTLGLATYTVPEGVYSITTTLAGGAGGNGGIDGNLAGSSGLPGDLITTTLDVKPGDVISIATGAAGGAGGNNKGSAGKGAGTAGGGAAGASLDPALAGATGGNAGAWNSSGGGGGSGAASGIYINGALVVVAAGGAGGGGAGNHTAGQGTGITTTTTAGQTKVGDGGGGGAGGTGIVDGLGGATVYGDKGGYSGTAGVSLLPAGSTVSTNTSGGFATLAFNYVAPNPTAGTLLSTYCSGVNKWGTYANGSGGTYQNLIEANSVDCGYVPPSDPGPLVLLSTYCSGVDKWGIYSGGWIGFGTHNALIESNSVDCGYVPPPPPPPTYNLVRSASIINEGASVSFTLYTTNLSNGTNIPYIVTGINAGDLTAGALSGNFVVGSASTVTFNTNTDLITEGPETLTITLTGPGVSASCAIVDTSETPVPTYTLTRSASSVNEGEIVTFRLTTTNVPDNTQVNFNIVGVNPADINFAPLSGYFIIQNNTDIIGFNVSNDLMVEGLEVLGIQLVNGRASSSVNIIDTSIPPQHFYVKDQGTYNEIEKIYVKNAGNWTPIRRVYTKSNGIWQLVFDKEVWSIMLSSVGTRALTTPWVTQAQCTVTMTFASSANATYYFNTGGKLKFYSSLIGGTPTLQNSYWTNLLNSAGTQEFSGNWNDDFNYYKLTNTYKTIYNTTSSIPYTANYYRIEAMCNQADNTAGGATIMTFRITWRDDYTSSPPESGITGTLNLTVDEIKGVAPSSEPPVTSPNYVLSSISSI